MPLTSPAPTLAAMTLEEIGSLIRTHREKLGLSIREMAGHMGLDQRNTKPLQHLEKGRSVNFTTLQAACTVLDLEVIVRPKKKK